MLNYRAPLADYRFLLHDVLAAPAALAGCFDDDLLSPDLFDSVVEEAAKLCESALLPINRDGDEIGCTLSGDVVTTPPGFRDAYDLFRQGGWIGLAADPDLGGQGLPFCLNAVLQDMMMAANLSFGDYVGLPQAAAKTIAAHGDDHQRQLYATRLISGEWCATMCMTEPQCGTDLGLISMAAKPQSDGSYRLAGSKIFISAGDHDLTPNIVHLVLARLPDAPAGTRGLSLFLCPKFMPDEHGAPGDRNAVQVVRLERKMGYHATSTCEMLFDDATAWLVGEPNRGLAAMFTMVNVARMLVALQGLGTAEAAYQAAAAYARDRRQGRSLAGPVDPAAKADPLIVHPDVRRMLLSMRSFTEAGRLIALWYAIELDIAERHPDDARRTRASDLIGLLTPVIKASFSDLGYAACNDGMQIFGGHGYIRDTGVEQLVRDSRIAQIQEGANGIQALDLIGRKLGGNGGRAWQAFIAMVRDEIAACGNAPETADFANRLAAALDRLERATGALQQRVTADPVAMGAAGVDYQRAFALVLFGWAWLQLARHSVGSDQPQRAASLHVARYFFERELPRIDACLAIADAPAGGLMDMPDDLF
jgi:alkylation response protein AidB-like acyl-CoA dehydrogenase